jgi:hypothetical protein
MRPDQTVNSRKLVPQAAQSIAQGLVNVVRSDFGVGHSFSRWKLGTSASNLWSGSLWFRSRRRSIS